MELSDEIGAEQMSLKLVKHVSAAGTVTDADYTQNGVYALPNTGSIGIHTDSTGVIANPLATRAYTGEKDWFENQKSHLALANLSGTS